MLHTIADSVLKRIRRSPLYYERYNNTLDFTTNQAYTRYARECAALYEEEHGKVELPPSPLRENGAVPLRGVFPADSARAYSERITSLIEHNDHSVLRPKNEDHLSVRIKNPLEMLGIDLLDVLCAPDVRRALLSFFRSHYRIRWVTCYRTFPAERVSSSWLWHSDCFPPHTCKMFLHLTEATAETGAMELMNLADTMAYRRAGYFGQYLDERYADLQDFARVHGLLYRPFHFDAAPGDATVFDMNFFHRAVPPRRGYRDVVQFYFLPNPIPWEEQLKHDGVDSFSNQKGSYPKHPSHDVDSASSMT